MAGICYFREFVNDGRVVVYKGMLSRPKNDGLIFVVTKRREEQSRITGPVRSQLSKGEASPRMFLVPELRACLRNASLINTCAQAES